MSIQLGSLVSHILLDYFGELVEKVGSNLFMSGSKSLPLIIASTGLPRGQVKKCLFALIKYGLVAFTPTKNRTCAEYSICKDNVLSLLRYPKYILHIKNRYGTEAEMIIEEILQEGSVTTSNIIFNIMAKVKDDKDKADVTVISLRNTLISLVTAGYVQHAPTPIRESEESDNYLVPTLHVPQVTPQCISEIDLRSLMRKVEGDSTVIFKNEKIWRVNLDRFHQDFRDDLLITATVRSIDECGGELMKHLLQLMYLDKDPWPAVSKPISFIELKNCCRKLSKNALLNQYIDQYLTVMEETSNGILTCCDDASGGQYVLKLAHASELLVWDLLYSVVQERLGTKAARIFRLIKTKKYIEEEDIQRNAMLPAKEVKQLTYKLLEENFIGIQALRKSTSASSGPSKAFYLYYIDLNSVANMMLQTTYKALYNIISRKEHEKSLNKWMIEKQQRVETIVHSLRLRGEPEENIKDIEETITPPEKLALERITSMIKRLSGAEFHLCDSLYILELYFMYENKT